MKPGQKAKSLLPDLRGRWEAWCEARQPSA